MNSNVNVSLDTRRQKKDGSYPVILRIGHNARTTAVALGFSVLEKDWDDERKIVKRSYAGVESIARLNNLIQKKKASAMDMLLKLHEAGVLGGLSVVEVRDRIVRSESTDSFFAYAERLVGELVEAGRIGTARSYKGLVAVLRTFCKGRELRFG